MNSLDFRGPTFMLEAQDLSPSLLDDLLRCGAPGPADQAVADIRTFYRVTGSQPDCKAFLRPYGAWEEHELQDHQTNLMRLVWLTGCALAEGETAYFSIGG